MHACHHVSNKILRYVNAYYVRGDVKSESRSTRDLVDHQKICKTKIGNNIKTQ